MPKIQPPLEKLRPEEEVALFLSGACALDWKKDSNGLYATNSNNGHQLFLTQDQVGFLPMFGMGISTYNLYVKKDSVSINIRTGEYNQECDKLLSLLFRIATQKSHMHFLGV